MKSNSQPLIFIVDDDPDDRQIILDAFLENSPQIDYVFIENAETLLENLHSEEYDFPALILLDLNMPGMSGFEVLRWIRNHQHFKRLCVIILSASMRKEDVETSFELGANSFLVKPVNFDHLVEISQAIKGYWLWLSKVPEAFRSDTPKPR